MARSGMRSKGTSVWPSYLCDATAVGEFQLKPPSSLRSKNTPLLALNPSARSDRPPRSGRERWGLVSDGFGPRNVAAMKLTKTRPSSSNFTIGLDAPSSKPAGKGSVRLTHVTPASNDTAAPSPA